ncbi:hypothetical protein [Corynebacterium glutamicum]|uniref:hypothetical protein n=1 Tax=Corynebacterium glutamicum TaxID=1718 RepID=UPI001B8C77D6|nr:hypothetical protein [Corynebacterium glutamicum]
MIPSTLSIDQRLRQWLNHHDWYRIGTGSLGEMWVSTTATKARVAIPHSLENDSEAFDGVINRLSIWSHIEVELLKETVELWDVDVSHFAANITMDEHHGRLTAPLNIVSHLLSGTGKVFRAAAHTSRGPKEVIGSWTAAGDASYHQVHAGFTEYGSYSLPVYVPIGGPVPGADTGTLNLPVPSTRRAITETAAKALDAVYTNIIKPDRAPTKREDIRHLVYEGVSKELVNAIVDLLGTHEADARTTFKWAPSHADLPSSQNLPTRIELPNESRELLETVSKSFKTPDPEPESMDGRITGILMGEDDEVTTVMAARRYGPTKGKNQAKGRSATIEVVHHNIEHQKLDQFFQWMKDGNKVFFTGSVTKSSNRLRVENPSLFTMREGLLNPEGEAEPWAFPPASNDS